MMVADEEVEVVFCLPITEAYGTSEADMILTSDKPSRFHGTRLCYKSVYITVLCDSCLLDRTVDSDRTFLFLL